MKKYTSPENTNDQARPTLLTPAEARAVRGGNVANTFYNWVFGVSTNSHPNAK